MIAAIITYHCPRCESVKIVKNSHDYKGAQKYPVKNAASRELFSVKGIEQHQAFPGDGCLFLPERACAAASESSASLASMGGVSKGIPERDPFRCGYEEWANRLLGAVEQHIASTA